MLENLSDKLQEMFANLNKRGKLTEKDIDDALKMLRLSLLEADVNYRVVKDFTKQIKEKAIGGDIISGLNGPQQVIKLVRDELENMLGADDITLAQKTDGEPTVYMIVGLQGGGKTTTAGKLAKHLKSKGKSNKPLLVATDLQRPAAISQLQTIGNAVGVTVFEKGTDTTPAEVAKLGLQFAKAEGYTHVIVDTAGRLHVDDALMDELEDVKNIVSPDEILLALDAMTGQDAVNVATQFNEKLDITGFIMTKMDGDTRGGGALSIRAVTGKPIKFIGIGEKYDALEEFHPNRFVSRIIGMGDVLTLIEKAEANFDLENAEVLEKKLKNRSFNLEDFLAQLDQMERMGPLDQLLDLLPGFSQVKKNLGPQGLDTSRFKQMRAIISSMTIEERRRPEIIKHSRKQRIAKGSGVDISAVSQMLKQFEQMKDMMSRFASGKMPGGMRLPF